jgi:uncharacterized OB-fold protein
VTAPKPVRHPRSSPSPLDQPYWDGLSVGEVRVQRCETCGARQWYPRPMCSRCYGFQLTWEPIEPHGRIYSFTVTHQRTGFSFDLRNPFVLAVVEFAADVSVRMAGQLIDVPPGEVSIDMPVRGVVAPASTDDDAPAALQFRWEA